MDYCAAGSIKDVMKAARVTLNETQLGFVCAETLKGLLYLHNMKIIHHDIKAGNILLNEAGDVKLGIFDYFSFLNNHHYEPALTNYYRLVISTLQNPPIHPAKIANSI